MAKKRVERGSGITAYEITQYSGPDISESMRAFSKRHNDLRRRFGGSFGAEAGPVAEAATDILVEVRNAKTGVAKAHPGDWEEQSLEYYAALIRRCFDIAKAEIARDNADLAAKYAFMMGYEAGVADVKFQFEEFALRGIKARKQDISRQEGSRERRATAKKVRAEFWLTEARKEAAKCRKPSQALIIRRLRSRFEKYSEILEKELGFDPLVSEQTARRYLKGFPHNQ